MSPQGVKEPRRRYRKRPVEVEAVEWTGDNWATMLDFVVGRGGVAHTDGPVLVIRTLEGDMLAAPGDWIVCGVEGEFYPVKPSIFSATYEPCL